ncbi:hypothetical protein HYU13_06745, partial [Candidatus Woesearchaeota archaeon]|nr:hypothetical protein [Candidatus Woesearchaeota archaeon]
MEIRSPACKAPLTGKLCEDPSCPACRKAKSLFRVKELLRSEDFFGSAPGVFVGHYGYPHLNVGILSPPERTERAWLYDAPRHWALSNMQIPEIIDCRTSLINSRFKAQVKDANKFLIMGQEVAMASKPVDVEINLEKKPRFSFQTAAVISPMGPNAALKDAKITENPKISGKVDKVVSGTDWKAGEAITYLFSNEFDENFLSRLRSIGNVGLKHSRRLVPTRWAI